MNESGNQSTRATLRCAIYTRKSSEEGLDMAFNSLDAQREAGIDYIKSQRHQGWLLIETPYDDGGYSGGNTDRPGLKRLLDDIAHGRVDIVLVYKVDRLSRSLSDFARLMQQFDQYNVSFVSVTQQFNTTTSMGRLTLNMLLSFAQFEREVAGERVRDKILATKKKGVWVTGQPPIGYRLPREGDPGFTPGDRTLRIIEDEAKVVRMIFEGYLKSGSLLEVAKSLNEAGYTTRRWTSSFGRTHGGCPITSGLVHRVLTNTIYIGRITHKRGYGKKVSPADGWPGLHQPIIEQALWDKVHARMAHIAREGQQVWTHFHLVKGKLRTYEGYSMSPSAVPRPASKAQGQSNPAKRFVSYYLSRKAKLYGHKNCLIKTLNSRYIDDLVRGVLLEYLKAHHGLDLLPLEPTRRDKVFRDVLHQVIAAPDRLTIELARAGIVQAVETISTRKAAGRPSSSSAGLHDQPQEVIPRCVYTPEIDDRGPSIVLTIRMQIRRHDGRRLLLNAHGQDLLTTTRLDGRPIPRDHIVRAIGTAYAWLNQLKRTGETVEALAQRCGVTDGRVHSLLPLTQLGPELLRAALTGSLGSAVTLTDLLKAASRLNWSKQTSLTGPSVDG